MKQLSGKIKIKLISKQEAQISCNGEVLSWNIFPYFKGNNSLTYDVFEQLNDYTEQLSDETCKTLFGIYKKMHSLLELPPITLDKELKELVKEFYSHTDINKVKLWVSVSANMVTPTVLEDTYVETDENTGNRSRTYIKEDYRWLVSLCVLLRFMTPVWGEYIAKTSKEKGNNFKEYYAGDLIKSSCLENCIPMIKLREFVVENIPKDRPLTSATMAAFSEEDIPEWFTRLIVVRKLCLDDITGTNNDSHLIKVMFQFIRHRLKTVDSSFLGIIKEKFTTETSTVGDDTHNISKIEGFKIREKIAAGDIALIRFYLRNYQAVAKRLNPDIDLNKVEQSLESLTPLHSVPLDPAQRAILQFVFRPVCSPPSLLLLKKVDLVKCLAVAQTVLWEAGWYDIAALLTAIKIPNDEYMNLTFSGVRARITKLQYDRLEFLYPYNKRPQGKQRIIKNQNVAVSDIERLTDVFTSNDWKLTIPQKWIEEKSLVMKTSRYSSPADIRVKIADLIIAVAEKEKPFQELKDQQTPTVIHF